MNSIDTACTPLKAQYDECFNKWFKDSFLQGNNNHEEACGGLFKQYRDCVKVNIFEIFIRI